MRAASRAFTHREHAAIADTLRPMRGFNWGAVSWGGPDEPAADSCSYCDAPIAEDDVPLILWNAEHWSARFCAACQQRWFGMRAC